MILSSVTMLSSTMDNLPDLVVLKRITLHVYRARAVGRRQEPV